MKQLLFVIMLLVLSVTFVHADFLYLINEDFEGTWPPAGWYVDSTTRSTAQSNSPTHSVYFDSYTDVLRTPLLEKPLFMTFWHRWYSYSYLSDFFVEISNSTSGPWTTLGYFVAGSVWDEETINLSAYNESDVYIRFVLQGSSASPECTKKLYIDDVAVYTCPVVPVELASFTANLVHEVDRNYVEINWTTHTETQVAGYNVLRNYSLDSADAIQLNASLIEATNTSNSTDYSIIDNDIETGTIYYWLQSNDFNGSIQMFGPISVTVNADNQTIPDSGISTLLRDVYPNPFVSQTNIPFQLNTKSDVKLDIYNQKGQLVWTYTKSNTDGGMYKVEWNGKDMNGKSLANGIYFCKMTSDNYMGLKKLVLMK